MTYIVQKLRELIDPDHPDLWKIDRERNEAAYEIERLRGIEDAAKEAAAIYEAEIERLRAALWEIAYDPCIASEGNSEIARKALGADLK